jgi:hypothetical protein
MLPKPVEEAVEGLIELGVLNEQGLIRLARLFAAVRALKDAGARQEILEPAGPGSAAKPRNGSEPESHEQPEVPAAPDPEFTDDPLGLLKIPDAPTKLKALPGFVAGYSEKNLEKEPAVPAKRKPRGSFHITPEDLKALRTSKTISQIANEYGVSVSTVVNRLRRYGLTGA